MIEALSAKTRVGAGGGYSCCSRCHIISHRFWAGGDGSLVPPRTTASCAWPIFCGQSQSISSLYHEGRDENGAWSTLGLA